LSAFEAPVLIAGETGTGKGLGRGGDPSMVGAARRRPSMPVNCWRSRGAVENQLSDASAAPSPDAKHSRRAWWRRRKAGRCSLDEWIALPARAQVALLRTAGQHLPAPSAASLRFRSNVRLIAAPVRACTACCRR
jgi:DNA-binding NtrC family response regulator